VITTDSSEGNELFVSRMFAPSMLPPPFSEDQVCGSAHCLLAPYWYKKKGLQVDQASCAKQVSSRGGYLGLSLDQAANTVGLKGETFVMAEGNIYI
jgi:predicted PhzF superfamily epimerase YddE/YHI9